MISFSVLGSGSAGNCTYVNLDGTGILLDCGLTIKQYQDRMERIDVDCNSVSFAFITHSHKDHCKDNMVKYLENSGVNIVWCGANLQSSGKKKIIEHYNESGFRISYFLLAHDVPCAGIAIDHIYSGKRIMLITDTSGIPCDGEILSEVMEPSAILLIECNHEIDILLDCNYRPAQKIRSTETHLDNDQVVDFLEYIHDNTNLKFFCAMHLSKKGNSREYVEGLFYKTIGSVVGTKVLVSSQDKPLPLSYVI